MDDDNLELEWKLRAAAIPAALVLAVAFHAWDTGHFLQRTFLSMMVHELGHAVTAWWHGFAALPTVWKTLIPETRGVLAPLLVGAINAGLVVWGWRTERTRLIAIGLALGGLQLIALGRTTDHAQEMITFGGDAGAMILGTALMMTFFVGPESRLRTNHLRWGFLVIGAAALVDTLATWWAAQRDVDVIPFGEIEGVGLSDPSRLTEDYGWTVRELVHRYTTVGALCLVALGLAWAWSVWTVRRDASAARG
jgi:hypothetical protein